MMCMNLFLYFSLKSYFESVSKLFKISKELCDNAFQKFELSEKKFEICDSQYENVRKYFKLVQEQDKSSQERYQQMQKNYFELRQLLEKEKENI